MQYDADEHDNLEMPHKRANSGGIVPITTSVWFDDDADFEKHRKKMKKSLRLSVKKERKLSDDDADDLIKSLQKSAGGSKNVFLGGTDAYDIAKTSDFDEMIASIKGDDDEITPE